MVLYINSTRGAFSLSLQCVVQSTSSTSSVPLLSSSSSSSIESSISVSGEGTHRNRSYNNSKETVKLLGSFSDVKLWVSVSESELEGCVTLAIKKKCAEATVN